MKKILLAAVAIALMWASGCSSVTPDAGHQSVLIEKPIIFGRGGVDPNPVAAGRTFVAWTTQDVDVNMQPQKYDTEMPDIMTSDGVPITFHAIAIMQVTDSVTLVRNFGVDWYKNNVEEQFKTMVRQAVRKHGMNETAISTAALDQIDSEIQSELIGFLKEKNLPVKLVTMTVGKANPPDAIKTQRIETAAQEQRIQTEQQTALAEKQRQQAETNRAEADNAYRESMHLTPEQFIELQRIKMLNDVCAKTACTFINGGVMPVLPVK
jgi:regulator of protease activity HflC (stomatin/prohibitin superfamily)